MAADDIPLTQPPKGFTRALRTLIGAVTVAIAACASPPASPPPSAPPSVASPAAPTPTPAPAQPTPLTPPASGPAAMFRPAAWSELPGWRDDNLAAAWPALLASCKVLAAQEAWKDACTAASRVMNPGADTARRYFEEHYSAYQVLAADGTQDGLMTGYYEPLLRGSRKPTARYRHPVYGVPDDLLIIDLAELYPELKGMRLRGRLEGRRVVPYYDRARIENGEAPVRGREIAWVEDAVELFFLHIQGSGRILLDTGETLRIGYAEQNGHPYRSIGRLLVERGELALEQASMQGIKAWVQQNPGAARDLLNSNGSYVFFRELPVTGTGPPGALGVPLTPRRSLAVDTRTLPLGTPVYVATTWPNTPRPLNLLMLAQDTGGAIRGALRGDFYWGSGEAAGREAGRMRQRARMWLLLPKGVAPPPGGG